LETFLQRSKSTLASSRVIPGSIESVCHLTRPSHALVCVVVNSEPPLLRMWSGTSLLTKRSLRRSKRSSLVNFLDASITRHFLVNSSITTRICS